MQIAALAIAEHARELEYFGFTGGEQFLGGELRRRPQIARRAGAVAAGQFGAWRMQMRLVARRDLQDGGLDLGKTLLVEPGPHRPGDRTSRHQEGLSIGVPRRRPPWRGLVDVCHQQWFRTGRHGSAPTEPINAFRESTNTIDIIRLSLDRCGKGRGLRSTPSFHVERYAPCPFAWKASITRCAFGLLSALGNLRAGHRHRTATV